MRSEADITREIYELLRRAHISSLKKICKGRSVTTSEFRNAVIGWYGREIPWPLVEPDLILVFEDYLKVVDETMIVAVEMKYFEETRDLDKRLRQSFRELGQPLRNLVFGFDSVVLWHIFSPDIEVQKIESYANMVEEVITKLKLPVAYFATVVLNGDFKIYKPLTIAKCDAESLTIWLRNLCDSSRVTTDDRETKIRRSCLKVALRIPS